MEKLKEEMRHAHSLVIACVVIASLALFVALSGSVTSVVVSKKNAVQANEIAQQAKAQTRLNHQLILHEAAVATDRRVLAHDIAVRACMSRHNDHQALISLLRSSLADSRQSLRSGLYDQFGPAVRAAIVRGNNRTQRLLDRMKASDCDPDDPRDVQAAGG